MNHTRTFLRLLFSSFSRIHVFFAQKQSSGTQNAQDLTTEDLWAVRQQELQRCLDAATPGGPFCDKPLSRRDITWLLAVYASQQKNHLSTRLRRAKHAKAFLDLRRARLENIDLQGIAFPPSNFTGANLRKASLQGCLLQDAILEDCDLSEARLEGALLSRARLGGANLHEVSFDGSTQINEISLCNPLGHAPLLADIRWGGVNLATVDWASMPQVGEEQVIKRHKHVGAYRIALRASRQLASTLRDQGLLEEANTYSYRAQALKYPLRCYLLLQKLRSHHSARSSLYASLKIHRFMKRSGSAFPIGLACLLPVVLLILLQTLLPPILLLSMFFFTLIISLFGLAILLQAPLLQILLLLLLQIVCVSVFQLGLIFLFFFLINALLPLAFTQLPVWLQIGIITGIGGAILGGLLSLHLQSRTTLISRLNRPIQRISAFYLYYVSLFRDFSSATVSCLSLGFLWFLDRISGYGYKPERCVRWYLATLASFQLLYVLAGLPFNFETFLRSITALHGRGFFPGSIPTSNGFLDFLVASEALIGLFLELSFIAAFTQRFYGK